MRNNVFRWGFLLFLILSSTSILAQKTAETDSLLLLLQHSLNTNFKTLSEKENRTYFMAYRVCEKELHKISSSFESLLENVSQKTVTFSVEVRVGNPEVDNLHASRKQYACSFETALPVDFNPKLISQKINSLTEKAWRDAVLKYAENAVETAFDNQEDYVYTMPGQDAYYEEIADFDFNEDAWLANLRFYTKGLSYFLRNASATLSYEHTRNYYVNTNNTYIVENKDNTYLDLLVEGVSDDNTIQKLSYRYYSPTPSQLPDEYTINAKTKELEEQLFNMLKSKSASYTECPVILSPKVSGVLIHNTLGHIVEGGCEDYPTAKPLRKICDEQFMAHCNPTISQYNDDFLSGSYKFDNESVKSQKVVLLKDGFLVEMLSSSTQSEYAFNPNGHSRFYKQTPSTGASNIIFETKKPLSHKKLLETLRNNLKAKGLEFGYFVADADIVCERNNIINIYPSVCYKIFADEREDELVKDLQLSNTAKGWLGNITNAGDSMGSVAVKCYKGGECIATHCCAPELLINSVESAPHCEKVGVLQQSVPTSGATESEGDVVDLFFSTAELEHDKYSEIVTSDYLPPYHSEFLMTDAKYYYIEASQGSIMSAVENDLRAVTPRLLMGSDKLNNENFYDGEMKVQHTYPLPKDNNSVVFRKFFSNAITSEYQSVLKQWEMKKQALAASNERTLDDRKPVMKGSVRAEIKWKYPSLEKMKELASAISDEISDIKNTQSTVVRIQACVGNAYFWSSEGVSYTVPVSAICLQLSADKAVGDEVVTVKKVLVLDNFDSIISIRTKSFLGDFVHYAGQTSLERGFAEFYRGPVLVEGAAVAKMISHALLAGETNILSQRVPVFARENDSRTFSYNNLENLVDQYVTNRNISVNVNGKPNSEIDAEGTRIEPLQIVVNGELVALLGSGTPSKSTPYSNGGRQIGISSDGFVSTKGAQSIELTYKSKSKQNKVMSQFLSMAKKTGARHAYIISDISFGGEAVKGCDVELYQIDLRDGTETAIYGANLSGLDFFALKNIVAASDDTQTVPLLIPFGNQTFYNTFPPSGVFTKVECPKTLLFDFLQVKNSY